MPFTFSHPAIVLPFNYLHKRWFAITALVVGSMTPDFEYFIRMKVSAYYSHTWLGLLWFDLPLGLILLLIYNNLVKDKLIDHLPAYFNQRLSAFKNSAHAPVKQSLLIIISSLLIGAASHLIWDSFTHPTGYFVKHIRLLRRLIFINNNNMRLFNILQYLSSLIGAIIIIYAIMQLPVGKLTNKSGWVIYWLKVFAVTVSILIVRLFTGLDIYQYGNVIVTAISAMLIGLIVVSVTTAPAQNESKL